MDKLLTLHEEGILVFLPSCKSCIVRRSFVEKSFITRLFHEKKLRELAPL